MYRRSLELAPQQGPRTGNTLAGLLQAQRELMEQLLTAPLDEQVSVIPWADEGLRRVCTALLQSPYFVLQGLPTPERAGAELSLEVPGSSRAELCGELVTLFETDTAKCDDEGHLSL